MKELVEFIVKELVSEPDKIKIVTKEVGSVEQIIVNVAPSDMGKIIGKQGKIAMAIRTVVKAASVKSGIKYSVEIVDEMAG